MFIQRLSFCAQVGLTPRKISTAVQGGLILFVGGPKLGGAANPVGSAQSQASHVGSAALAPPWNAAGRQGRALHATPRGLALERTRCRGTGKTEPGSWALEKRTGAKTTHAQGAKPRSILVRVSGALSPAVLVHICFWERSQVAFSLGETSCCKLQGFFRMVVLMKTVVLSDSGVCPKMNLRLTSGVANFSVLAKTRDSGWRPTEFDDC